MHRYRFQFQTATNIHDFPDDVAARAAWLGLPEPRPHVARLHPKGDVPLTESRPTRPHETGPDGAHLLPAERVPPPAPDPTPSSPTSTPTVLAA